MKFRAPGVTRLRLMPTPRQAIWKIRRGRAARVLEEVLIGGGIRTPVRANACNARGVNVERCHENILSRCDEQLAINPLLYNIYAGSKTLTPVGGVPPSPR